MSTVNFYWNDSALKAGAAEGYRLALRGASEVMRELCAWPRVAASISVTSNGVRVGSRLAPLLEKGARPHAISAEGGGPAQTLKFPDGGFSGRPVQHPGFDGSPFMKPTAELWPEICTQALRLTMPKGG